MRRYVVIALVLTLASQLLLANPITVDEAKTIASEYMKGGVKPTLIRKATRKHAKALSSKYMNISPYYIFSRGENKGFVIVSGDDALPEVLGFTESGDYDEENMPPFLKWYLDYYCELVERAQEVGAERMALSAAASGWESISPMIQTHWNQGAPYNDKCPQRRDGQGRCVTGCVATAACQILYYWRKDLPDYTLAEVKSYRKGTKANDTMAFAKGTPIKWELMRTQYQSEPQEYRDAVSTLMAVVGGYAQLEYGPSTAGYLPDANLAFQDVFGMQGGKHYYKDRGDDYNIYSDDQWASMIYRDLAQNHPVFYAGCNEAGEGHAIVIDGYLSTSGLFHFNLGWGGQGDGYFTVARGKSPSWGFNSSWQECVTGVYPKKQKLDGKIECPVNMYKGRTNTVTVKVKNHGTIDYSGVYVYINSRDTKPSTLTDAKDKDETTILTSAGEEHTFKFNVKPTTKECYITVTDKRTNILAQVKVETVEPENELWLEGFAANGSIDKVGDYTVVYNAKATLCAKIANKSNVGYDGTLKMDLYGSSDGGNTFNYVGTKSAKATIEANGVGDVEFSIISTTSVPVFTDTLYMGEMQMVSTTGDTIYIDDEEGNNAVAKFVMNGSDMEVDGFTDRCLSFKGHWDANSYLTAIKKSSYKNALSYDLTNVESVGEVPVSPVNPNAICYVTDKNATGWNVVCEDECKKLVLVPGFDFAPRTDCMVEFASVEIKQTPNKWYLFTAPCDLDVPYGMLARTIDSHGSTGISSKTSDVKTLEAGKTYLLITTSSANQILSKHSSQVVTALAQNPDTAIVGTFVNTSTPDKAMIPDMEDSQYFRFVDEGTSIEAFRGYFLDEKQTREFRAYSSLVADPTYNSLGIAINEAYEAISESVDPSELLDSINKVERIYSARELDNKDVKLLTANLQEMIEDYIKEVLYAEGRGIDYSGNIINPSFEDGKTTGWTVEDTRTAQIKKTTEVNYKGVGADGTYLMYCFSSNKGCEISQEVKGLIPGYYRLTAMVGTDPDSTVTVFAGDSTVSVKAHEFGKYYLTEAEINDIPVYDGTLTIGVKAGHWYKADDFRLTYITGLPVGIEEVYNNQQLKVNDQLRNVNYNLAGQRVGEDYKGIVINNGKKYLRK